MPPAKAEQQSMAIFAPGRNLGSVGMAFMDAAIDMSDGNIIDANTGEFIEEYLNNKELAKAGVQGSLSRPAPRSFRIAHALTAVTDHPRARPSR